MQSRINIYLARFFSRLLTLKTAAAMALGELQQSE
jgi:hypothetical protein